MGDLNCGISLELLTFPHLDEKVKKKLINFKKKSYKANKIKTRANTGPLVIPEVESGG